VRVGGWTAVVGTVAVGAAGLGTLAGSPRLIGLALVVIAVVHVRLLRQVATTVVVMQRDSFMGLPHTATIALWMQTLGRRTGQLPAHGWVCRRCLQANVAWDDECGRCGAENLDGVLTKGTG
jgi:hypothetical protein